MGLAGPLRNSNELGGQMENLVILAAIGFGGWWLYKSGKRDGSRKAFGAGRRAGRQRHLRRSRNRRHQR